MTHQATENIKAEHAEGLMCNHGMTHKQELVANVYDTASDQVEDSLDEPNTTAGEPNWRANFHCSFGGSLFFCSSCHH